MSCRVPPFIHLARSTFPNKYSSFEFSLVWLANSQASVMGSMIHWIGRAAIFCIIFVFGRNPGVALTPNLSTRGSVSSFRISHIQHEYRRNQNFGRVDFATGYPLYAEAEVIDLYANEDAADDSATNDFKRAPEESINDILSVREKLKQSLIKLGASYDRGYGSTSSSRNEVEGIIDRLEALNPTSDAARGITGDGSLAPLKGIWRMVWTTATDVLTLAASPFTTVGSIYQVIEPPVATNIIDFIPRAQALFPPGVFPSTLIRAEVTTRASSRPGYPLRVGLIFESVKVKPIELLGVQTQGVLPPLSFTLPQINIQNLPGVDPENPPGFFDVSYLDEEMLIIKQNAPGGLFVLIKADSFDP